MRITISTRKHVWSVELSHRDLKAEREQIVAGLTAIMGGES